MSTVQNKGIPQISYEGIINAVRHAIIVNRINLRQLYDQFDDNRGGTIDINEFTNLLNSFCRITPRTCAAIFNTVDENKNGRMDFDEFRRLFDQYYGNYGPENFISQLRDANVAYQNRNDSIFNQFNFDGNDYLDISEFKVLCLAVRPTLTDKEIRQLFNHFDSQKSGAINYTDFKRKIE